MAAITQRGNVLFLILIAVALFAALSYAVTSSTRTNTASISDDQAKAGASALLAYMNTLRAEVQKLQTVYGCDITNIDWRSSVYKSKGGTLLANLAPLESKNNCSLFVSRGGNVPDQNFFYLAAPEFYNAQLNSVWTPGHFSFRYVNMIDNGSSENDFAALTVGIDPKVCVAILKIFSAGSIIPNDPFSFTYDYTETPTLLTGTNRIGDDATNLKLNGLFMSTYNSNSGWGSNPPYIDSCFLGTILFTK